MSIENFKIKISQELFIDLNERLVRTRWPDEVSNTNRNYCTYLSYLKS
ncbi:MAG: hypothetical protein ACLQG5_03985 [Methanobacterium sp.]|jgi:hypothetical protein